MDYLVTLMGDGRKWAKIVGILFIIMAVLQLLGLFFGAGSMPEVFASITSALLYLVPGVMLLKYNKAVEKAESGQDMAADLEDACLAQAKYFQFVGIAAAVGIVFMIIAIIIMVVTGVNLR